MIEELEALAAELGPELVKELIAIGRAALGGASKTEIVTKAERLATLAAFKASYRVDP